MNTSKIFKIVVTGFAFGAAATAFSSPASDELHEQMLKIGDQIKECVDFSGTWKGTCETKNLLDPAAKPMAAEQTMKFTQKDCAGLMSEAFGPALIGTTSTKSMSSERGTLTMTGGTWWEDNGQKLGMAEEFFLNLYGSDALMRKGHSKGAFTRDGDAIVGSVTSMIKSIGADGTIAVVANEESSCRLMLQPQDQAGE